MSDHVVLWVSDFLAAELSPERAREIEEHLDECEDCSADFAWVRELQEQALRDGVRHLAVTRVVELAFAADDATVDAERRHLAACTFCRGEIAWAKKDPPESAGRADEVSGARRPAPSRALDPSFLRWLGVALAAAAVLAVVFLIPRGPDVSRFARVESLDVTLTRGAVEPGSFEESRRLGLEAYGERDYDSAVEHLSRAAEMRPEDAEALLYLGSASLLLGNGSRAAADLRRAVDAAPNPMLRREAQWQLANAELAADRLDEARRILEPLADRAGSRREEAAELLVQLPTD